MTGNNSDADDAQTETALRTAGGAAVFVDDGSYVDDFPRNAIVRADGVDDPKYVVYGFVGSHGDFEEVAFVADNEDDAVDYATFIYGKDTENRPNFERDGEIFEVEVHERADADVPESAVPI